jgi:hypothetical protein
VPKRVNGKSKLRIPVLTRVTPDVRKLLEAAAEASGRSLSGEIEYRITAGFDREATVRAVLAEQAPKFATDPDAPPLWPSGVRQFMIPR